MEGALSIFDQIVGGFLTAIEAGGTNLARFGIGILSVVFVLTYVREFGPRLAQGTGSLSDALGAPLLYFVMVAGYMYVLLNLVPMTTAALDTAVGWGLQMGGSALSPQAFRAPSFIVQVGLDVAKPIAQFDTTWQAIKSTINMAMHPSNMAVFWLILLAFIGMAVSFGVFIIEFTLSVSLSYVLLPWSIWRPSASLGEFAVGWVLGGLVRALVSCAIVGVSVPLFPLLLADVGGFLGIDTIVTRVVGTLFFATIAIAVPIKVANWASRAGLALTGSTVMAGAMTFARFSMMGQGAVRGVSQLVGRGY